MQVTLKEVVEQCRVLSEQNRDLYERNRTLETLVSRQDTTILRIKDQSRARRRRDKGIISELELVITELRRNRQQGVAPYRRARSEQMIEPPFWLTSLMEDRGS